MNGADFLPVLGPCWWNLTAQKMVEWSGKKKSEISVCGPVGQQSRTRRWLDVKDETHHFADVDNPGTPAIKNWGVLRVS